MIEGVLVRFTNLNTRVQRNGEDGYPAVDVQAVVEAADLGLLSDLLHEFMSGFQTRVDAAMTLLQQTEEKKWLGIPGELWAQDVRFFAGQEPLFEGDSFLCDLNNVRIMRSLDTYSMKFRLQRSGTDVFEWVRGLFALVVDGRAVISVTPRQGAVV